MSVEIARKIGLDLSDVERRAGQWVGGGELIEPMSALDIRRWVQAMDYANPLHWDEALAAASKFGEIIAPQSFVLATDSGHSGMPAAIVGCIPDAHMIVGSEEWWFSGHRIRPGELIRQRRRFDGVAVKELKAFGPTVFSTGDTFHETDRGAPIAHVRTTALRYSAQEAEKRSLGSDGQSGPYTWSESEFAQIKQIRHEWILSNREGRTPSIGDVKVGDKLPQRAVGPHSLASFATEWRAFPFQTWGAHGWARPAGVDDPWVDNDPGTIKGFELDREGAMIDPRLIDGLYAGPAGAHVNSDKAKEVGIGRAYGYGASMSAWFADYLEYWAGHDGRVRHTKFAIKGPAFEGDATLIDGEIVDVEPLSPLLGVPLVTVQVRLTSQTGAVLVDGTAQVEIGF
ncbi:MAG: MaoC family dehydratase N-terminal domain-containing protein [Novosphingobium sp.]|nr:MaoC family dehydratase N-terminal domain-containing protein [Novosphingobium sp.]